MSVETATAPVDAWRATLSGLCASLVGIGLARFAYTPLLPTLIDQGWFDASDAAYLGAANLAGYLLGVLAVGVLSSRVDSRLLLRAAMVLAAVSFFACAYRAGFGWFFLWRLMSGVAGGVAMILAAPTILPHVPPARRGLVSGAVFMGVGIGIALSGTLIPLLLKAGLVWTWLGLGFLASVLALVGWGGWPARTTAMPPRPQRQQPSPKARSIRFLSIVYGFNAFGLVPHMVFLVAFVSRGLNQGIGLGTSYWTVFGLGAVAGPILMGHLADRIGPRLALRFVLVLEAVFVALLAVSYSTPALIISSAVVGACTIGVVPVVLSRTRDILQHHPSAQPAAWRTATTYFALFQAVGAYALSYIFSKNAGDYRLLFTLGAGAMLVALMVEWVTPLDTETI